MQPVMLTLSLMTLSTLIAVPLGLLWGWSIYCIECFAAERLAASSSAVPAKEHSGHASLPWQRGFRRSRLLQRMASNLAWIVLLTMLAIPLYLHAAGWEATAGKFGWIPLVQGGTRFWFRGLLAASWIHGTYGACWVTMATILGLRSVPKSIVQLTNVDGGGGRITWLVQLPIVLPWVVAAAIWNCVIAATEMTVADLYGVRTVADDVYKVYALRPDSVSMLLTSWIPIAFVAITLWTLASRRYDAATWRKWLGEGRYGESSEHTALQSRLIHAPWQQAWILGLALLIGLGIAAIPISALVVKAGWSTVATADGPQASFSWRVLGETLVRAPGSFATELGWTLQLGFFSALSLLPIAWGLASFARRSRWTRSLMPWICALLLIIPGPVISLWVVELFNRPSLSALYDQSLVPTIVAIAPRGLPVAYIMLRAAYGMLDSATIACEQLDGPSLWQRLFSIEAVRIWKGILVSAIAVFLVAVADLSASLLVLPPSVTTVAARLFGLLHSGVRNQEAGLALLIAGVSMIAALVIRRVAR